MHLSDPEFEIDSNDQKAHEASVAFGGSRVEGAAWLPEASQEGGRGEGAPSASSSISSNALSVPVTPTTTTAYSQDPVHVVSPSAAIPTSKASSFDVSLLFTSHDYDSAVHSAIVTPDVSDRPCLPSYLNQPLLVSPAASAAPPVFWYPSVHTATPVYQ